MDHEAVKYGIITGNPKVFNYFYDRIIPKIEALCKIYPKLQIEPLELYQETMEKLLATKIKETIMSIQNIYAYFFSICRNSLIKKSKGKLNLKLIEESIDPEDNFESANFDLKNIDSGYENIMKRIDQIAKELSPDCISIYLNEKLLIFSSIQKVKNVAINYVSSFFGVGRKTASDKRKDCLNRLKQLCLKDTVLINLLKLV